VIATTQPRSAVRPGLLLKAAHASSLSNLVKNNK
jgi:hypothetical protein